MSNIGSFQSNLNAATLANLNSVSILDEDSGIFDGRAVRQLERAANSTPSPTSNVTILSRTNSNANITLPGRQINPTSPSHFSDLSPAVAMRTSSNDAARTISEADITRLQEVASKAKTVEQFRALAVELEGLASGQLMQVLAAQDKHGRTPMHWATKDTASLQILAPFLNKLAPTQIADLLKTKDRHGNTPMHCAARDADATRSAAEQDVRDELNTIEASRWSADALGAARRDAARQRAQNELVTLTSLIERNLDSQQDLRAVIAIENPTGLLDLEPFLNKLKPAQITELLKIAGQGGDTLLHILAKQGNAEEISLLREWLLRAQTAINSGSGKLPK